MSEAIVAKTSTHVLSDYDRSELSIIELSLYDICPDPSRRRAISGAICALCGIQEHHLIESPERCEALHAYMRDLCNAYTWKYLDVLDKTDVVNPLIRIVSSKMSKVLVRMKLF